MTRILFAYPGGEIPLKDYRIKLPVHRVLAAVEEQANLFFGPGRWDWESDPEVPAIEGPRGGMILACIKAPNEPTL